MCRLESYGCPCAYPPVIVDCSDLDNIGGKDRPEEPSKYSGLSTQDTLLTLFLVQYGKSNTLTLSLSGSC